MIYQELSTPREMTYNQKLEKELADIREIVFAFAPDLADDYLVSAVGDPLAVADYVRQALIEYGSKTV